MVFRVPTRYEPLILVVSVATSRPEKIRIVFKDEKLNNTVFTDRYKTVNGSFTFYIRVPVCGLSSLLEVFNDKNGNMPQGRDNSFTVTEVRKAPLEKKLDLIDFNNPVVKSFVSFCTKFCYNAGVLNSKIYTSNDGIFTIEYLPTIISSKDGKELNTPARISKGQEDPVNGKRTGGGRMQVSQKKFVPMTVPGRMAIMMHEFSHYYINDDINNETEADLNGLLIYLGLGYPRIEAYEAFLGTFVGTPSQTNKDRYDVINKFIRDFEKNNYLVYE